MRPWQGELGKSAHKFFQTLLNVSFSLTESALYPCCITAINLSHSVLLYAESCKSLKQSTEPVAGHRTFTVILTLTIFFFHCNNLYLVQPVLSS